LHKRVLRFTDAEGSQGGKALATLHEEHVISEFQLRRKRLLRNFGTCLILIALSLILLQVSDSFSTFLGIGKMTWKALATAQFVAGVVFALIGFLGYRCPVCSEVVKGHDRYYFGVILDPAKCPKCGARLR
jgi:hypothetical protein